MSKSCPRRTIITTLRIENNARLVLNNNFSIAQQTIMSEGGREINTRGMEIKGTVEFVLTLVVVYSHC